MTAKFALYGQSKLANVLYASEFAKRYPQVTTASVHPGVIFNTALANHIGLVERLIIKAYCFNLKHFDSHEGAYNTLWAATTSDKKILESGGVYEPVGKPVAASKYSSDSAIAAELWAWTDEALANVS
jgi:NAD(P)-dependent dehydrogenase (short-subunit alcohol dehydrogenase family)